MVSKMMIALTALVVTASVAQAEERIYGGVLLGGNILKGSGDTVGNLVDEDKTGYLMGVKGFYSLMEQSYILDGGLGYEYNEMKGNAVKMTIKTAYLDLAAKYRLDKNWSLGGQMEYRFGTESTFIQQNDEGRQGNALMMGGQLAYDTAWGNLPVRYDASLLMNLNGDQRNIVAKVGLSFSFWERSKTVSKPAPKVVKEYVDKEEVADIKVVLKFAKVSFGTDEYRLDQATQNKLTKLGQFLAKNPDMVRRIKISGHTDERGGKDYNVNLSKDRADSVMKTFAEAGVSEAKMESVGYGFARPLDTKSTPEAWEKNRRTEIEFFGVKDRTKLNKVLEQILK